MAYKVTITYRNTDGSIQQTTIESTDGHLLYDNPARGPCLVQGLKKHGFLLVLGHEPSTDQSGANITPEQIEHIAWQDDFVYWDGYEGILRPGSGSWTRESKE